MKNNIAERDVVDIFLNNQKNEKYFFIEEVPVFLQSVDVVKVSKRMKTITAIEFKTKKWEKAIEQVLAEELVFDYLEIAIVFPKRETTRQRVEIKCQEHGIGLYYVDMLQNKVIHKIKPKRNKSLWPTQRKAIKAYLQERLTDDRNN